MHTDTTPKLAFTIPEACYSIGIGRSKLYQLIGQGRVRTRKIGARTLITAESLRLLLESSE